MSKIKLKFPFMAFSILFQKTIELERPVCQMKNCDFYQIVKYW